MIENHKRLRYNTLALATVQVANFAFPLVTLPYLTRTLGVDGFGKVTFVQVVMSFACLFIDYGFSWSATREISEIRHDRAKIASLFANNWSAQWLLAAITIFVLSIGVTTLSALQPDAHLFIAGFLILIGAVIFPLWLLQGLEHMKEVAIIQVVARLILLPFLFVMVRGPEDVLVAILIQSGGMCLAGAISLLWIITNRVIDFQWPERQGVKHALLHGGRVFVSRLLISIYTSLIPLILGVVSGVSALSFFNLADKARGAAQAVLSPLSQALYPRMSFLFCHDRKSAIILLKRSGLILLSGASLLSLMLWMGADQIINLLGGGGYADAVIVLKWLAPVPFFIAVSNLFGVQVLLANGETRLINSTASIVGLVVLILVYPMTARYSAQGAAALNLMAEISVAFVYAFAVTKRKGWNKCLNQPQ